MSELSNIEKDIIAGFDKLTADAKRGALEARKSKLAGEIEEIEALLKGIAKSDAPEVAQAKAVETEVVADADKDVADVKAQAETVADDVVADVKTDVDSAKAVSKK